MINPTTGHPLPEISRKSVPLVSVRHGIVAGSKGEKGWSEMASQLNPFSHGEGHPGAIFAMTRHAFGAFLGLVLAFGSVLSATGPTGRVEQATSAVKRYVSPNGYQVSIPTTWRVLKREGFRLLEKRDNMIVGNRTRCTQGIVSRDYV